MSACREVAPRREARIGLGIVTVDECPIEVGARSHGKLRHRRCQQRRGRDVGDHAIRPARAHACGEQLYRPGACPQRFEAPEGGVEIVGDAVVLRDAHVHAHRLQRPAVEIAEKASKDRGRRHRPEGDLRPWLALEQPPCDGHLPSGVAEAVVGDREEDVHGVA